MVYYSAQQFSLSVMSPLQAYQQRIKQNMLDDPAQQQAVLALDSRFIFVGRCWSWENLSDGSVLSKFV